MTETEIDSQMRRFDEAVNAIALDEGFRTLVAAGVFDPSPSKRLLATRLAEFNNLVFDPNFDDERFLVCWGEAKKDASVFDGLKAALALRISQGTPLTRAMETYIVGVLFGSIERPQSNGGHNAHSSEMRNALLVGVVNVARGYGLNPFRGESKINEGLSGCDAVVEGLSRIGYSVSYDTVCNAYKNRTKFSGMLRVR